MRSLLRELGGTSLLCSLLLTGCGIGSRQASENPIKFESISVEKIYHLLDDPNNPNCNLEIQFTYPSTYTANEEILHSLQTQFISSYFGENYEQLSPKEAVKEYTEDYLASYKELEEDFRTEIEHGDDSPVSAWFSYYEMSSNEIIYNRGGIISYTVSFENYTGGAHGAHSHNHHVLDLNTGLPIMEEDIFNDNYQDALAQILVDKIAQENNLTDAKELENIGFFSVDEIFPNGNFLVDETGITYSFNEYEIAAYVVGITNIHLPYKEIRYLLKDESPIANIIGN